MKLPSSAALLVIAAGSLSPSLLAACGPSARAARAAQGTANPGADASLAHDDAIAKLVLAGYDPATHRAAVERLADASELPKIRARSTRGDVLETWAPKADGDVKVRAAAGAEWAAGLEVDWILVGEMPSLCGNEQGFMALVRYAPGAPTLLALSPWDGGCATDGRDVRFVTASGQKLLLEGDADAGEESPTEGSYRVWALDGATWASAGTVRRSLEDTRDGSASNGFLRAMTASIEGTDAGLRVQEVWSFKPLTGGAAHEKRASYVLPIENKRLAGKVPADPSP